MKKSFLTLSIALIALSSMAFAQAGGGAGTSPGTFGGGTSASPSTIPGGAGIPGGGIGPGAGISGSPSVTGPTTPNIGVQTNPMPGTTNGPASTAPNMARSPACPPGTGPCPTLPGAQR